MLDVKQIVSPLPGVFYRKSSPEEPPFVVEGQMVKVGDVIGLIEIMKTYIEVQSQVDGKIVKFSTEHEDLVEPGQVIAEVE